MIIFLTINENNPVIWVPTAYVFVENEEKIFVW